MGHVGPVRTQTPSYVPPHPHDAREPDPWFPTLRPREPAPLGTRALGPRELAPRLPQASITPKFLSKLPGKFRFKGPCKGPLKGLRRPFKGPYKALQRAV